VDEKSGSHVTFESLAKTFLSFFQLPVRHDTGLEILFEFKQTMTFHIIDHIHEWCRQPSFCQAETTKEQCLDWFLKLLAYVIAKDVASIFPELEEEAIRKAQQFDFIYAQLGYLYIVFSDAPIPIPFGQDEPGMPHVVDGLIGSMTHRNPYGPPVTYLWCKSVSATIWRDVLLPSPHSPTIRSCYSLSAIGGTPTHTPNASVLSLKYGSTPNPHI
jgi:hypothetical protein